MQNYTNLIQENPQVEKFLQRNYLHKGFNISFQDLPALKVQLHIDNVQHQMNIKWKHSTFTKDFLLKSNFQNYSMIMKAQSASQQQIHYLASFSSIQNGHAFKFGLNYLIEKDLLSSHSISPIVQFNLLQANISNLDIGCKYNYRDVSNNLFLRMFFLLHPFSNDTSEFCLMGNLINKQRIQIGISNKRLWTASTFKFNVFNCQTIFEYNIKQQKPSICSFFEYQGQHQIFQNLTLIGGLSSQKEVMMNIKYLTTMCNFSYCAKWQYKRGITVGVEIEI